MMEVLSGFLGVFLSLWILKVLARKSFVSGKSYNSKLTRLKEFSLNMDYVKSLEKSKEAIRLFNLKLQKFDEKEGRLIALTSMDFYSIGEIITIKLFKDGIDNTKIEVESKPAIPFTMVDYGRNQANVDALYRLLISYPQN